MADTEVAISPSELQGSTENNYIIRPNFKDKFKPALVISNFILVSKGTILAP